MTLEEIAIIKVMKKLIQKADEMEMAINLKASRYAFFI